MWMPLNTRQEDPLLFFVSLEHKLQTSAQLGLMSVGHCCLHRWGFFSSFIQLLFTVNPRAGVKLHTVIQLQWAPEVKNNLNWTWIDMKIICFSTAILVLYVLEILLLLYQVFAYRSKLIKCTFIIILLLCKQNLGVCLAWYNPWWCWVPTLLGLWRGFYYVHLCRLGLWGMCNRIAQWLACCCRVCPPQL